MKIKVAIKWLARIIGGLAVVFFLYVLVSIGGSQHSEEFSLPYNSMMLLLGFAALGYLFAWFREKEGGIIMIVAGIIMGLYMFYHGGSIDNLSITMYTMPFLIPGLLFWWVGRKAVNN
jgi:hydrogenase/urease accessory protein HupE